METENGDRNRDFQLIPSRSCPRRNGRNFAVPAGSLNHGFKVKERHECGKEENQDKKWFLDTVNGESSSYKAPQIKVSKVSVARWDEDLELGEVIENKGCIWRTTGIIRNGKLYCHIEELLFLVDKGTVILRNIDNTTHGIEDIIIKVASGKAGCSWEAFLAYRHLKSLGYIVGRYNTSWTMENKEVENLDDSNHGLRKLTFQVHFPYSNFKKTSPGDPGFILCVLRERPPSSVETETLQKKCGKIPLKFCYVDRGHVSFFSHQNFVPPTLQERDDFEISEGNQGISSLLAIINEDTFSKTQFSDPVKSDTWKNHGIDQNGNEGKLFFVDREIPLECSNSTSFSTEETFLKLASEKKGWAQDVLVVYNYLMSFGYLVEHFESPWSIQSYKDNFDSHIIEESTNCSSVKHYSEVEKICTLLADMQISDLGPTFNVSYRHSSLKKSSSCDRNFIVCVLWKRPPSRKEAENLQKKCGNIPLKFCLVDGRSVTFFSYEKIVLPTLP